MGIGRKGQGEGDDNNQRGHVNKEQLNAEQRATNRLAKLYQAGRKATNHDGNKGKR